MVSSVPVEKVNIFKVVRVVKKSKYLSQCFETAEEIERISKNIPKMSFFDSKMMIFRKKLSVALFEHYFPFRVMHFAKSFMQNNPLYALN